MEKHVTVVGALRIGFGALGVLIALFVVVAIVGGGLISQDQEAILITSIVGPVVAAFILLFSLPSIIGGFGLLRRKSWARILVLILSLLDLLIIPIGTVFGGYSIWVLLNDETEEMFQSASGPAEAASKTSAAPTGAD